MHETQEHLFMVQSGHSGGFAFLAFSPIMGGDRVRDGQNHPREEHERRARTGDLCFFLGWFSFRPFDNAVALD